ncbi:MAG: transcription termination/antitermination NusG family protein [Candidatus Pelethousia sp.]|nr:transcription termination/antitermination NusG family protein [Candidatus Pelethousia sp.]
MQGYPFVYCVSCDAGSENVLKSDLERQLQNTCVLFPLIDREELKNGVWTIKTRPLLPGYVFIYSREPIEPHAFYHCQRVNRLLGYAESEHSEYILSGGDLDFAQWVLCYEGHISVSRAMLVGDKTQVIDGPLKAYEGEILKIDRRHRSALVAVKVGEMTKNVWLSFHWMTLQEGVLVDWKR